MIVATLAQLHAQRSHRIRCRYLWLVETRQLVDEIFRKRACEIREHDDCELVFRIDKERRTTAAGRCNCSMLRSRLCHPTRGPECWLVVVECAGGPECF